jgi:DNA polymerase-3 subunit epsilon
MRADSHDLRQTSFAVVDLETTGISPLLHDRALEVAIVRLSPDAAGGWNISDEYATLLNPDRDVGPIDLHGISASTASMAPRFGEIAGDVAQRLSGAIVAAHNLRFDLTFLQAEYGRLGVRMPHFPGVCTLRLASRIYPSVPSRKLQHLCEEVGILHEDCHSALNDARATAHLLVHYIANGLACGWRTVRDLVHPDLAPDPCDSSWAPTTCGKAVSRELAGEKSRRESSYLASLVARLPALQQAGDAASSEYLALLDRVLEDRLATKEEAHALLAFAENAGLSRSRVLDLHREYLRGLVRAALYDGVVTAAERRDLDAVCDLLDLHRAALEELLASTTASQEELKLGTLRGNTVCFTGALNSTFLGEPITRELAERLATESGLVVMPSVTKRLELLVVADPRTASGKAEKARRYGTRILAESVFWNALGIRVD